MVPEKTTRKKTVISLFAVLAIIIGISIYYLSNPWGFARKINEEEGSLRLEVVSSAEKYLGYCEENNSHQVIIDIYNSYLPLAQDYVVRYEDSWCAAFVSAISIQCKLTDIIPTECGCERQIGLFQEMNCWEESDSYLPLPGDIIYYAWDEEWSFKDCTGWADHVGIIVGTAGPIIKVIEGNKDNQVAYRYIPVNHPDIRGFALPNYSAKSA